MSLHAKPAEGTFTLSSSSATVTVINNSEQELPVKAIPHLNESLFLTRAPNPIARSKNAKFFSHEFEKEASHHSYVLGQTTFDSFDTPEDPPIVRGPFYFRAGVFPEIYFDVKEVKAAIVTCGGLCPGLNNVVREITMTLRNIYGVDEVWGIPYGYRGFYDISLNKIPLTAQRVSQIHHLGGTMLASSRGGMEVDLIMNAVEKLGYNQIYIIGGDGTHRGANKMYLEARRRGLHLTVAGIPKTIDNDIAIIDKSFGFDTAVEEACRAIKSGHVEAKSAPNCISIVKLMGRSAGFIAMYASLASRNVNVCLIPEVSFKLEPLMKFLEQRIRTRGHAVICVAEGAGQDLCESLKETDASGNPRLADIALLLKTAITEYCKTQNIEVNLKMLDPTYMVRSVAANASDSVYCSQLAQAAVHGSMAGYTGFTVGMVNSRFVYLPFDEITGKIQRVDPNGRMYQRLLLSTGQPDLS